MAKYKKKRRPGGRHKQRPKTAERMEIKKNPIKQQLELINALRPHAEQVRERLLRGAADGE